MSIFCIYVVQLVISKTSLRKYLETAEAIILQTGHFFVRHIGSVKVSEKQT